MNKRTRRGGQSWTLSILLHLGLIAAAFGVWYWTTHRRPVVQSMGIQAHVVTSDALARPQPLPPPEPEPAPEPELEPEPETQIQPPDPGPTQQEIAAQEAETARVAEEKRLAAEREVAERKAAAAKAERERKEREARETAAREKAEKEKAERERLAREQAAAALRQREDELGRQLAEEERQAKLRNSDLMSRYIGQIANKIESNWRRPPNAIAGISCQVHVTQTPGGTVTKVDVTRCNGDAAVRQSIEDAVFRASPLPDPPDPALFERDLVVTFRPD